MNLDKIYDTKFTTYQENVKNNWPRIVAALKEVGIIDDLSLIAAAATTNIETARRFAPINEMGGKVYWAKYNNRKDLGNHHGKDFGIKYHGRGYIQLTGFYNYRKYGDKLKVDLVNNPELANDPTVAARVFATYFKDHGIDVRAKKQDWEAVRRAVNGGTNGYKTFKYYVDYLLND